MWPSTMPRPGLGVDPVVDREVAGRPDRAGEVDGLGGLASTAPRPATHSTSTASPGPVSASPGWKTRCPRHVTT